MTTTVIFIVVLGIGILFGMFLASQLNDYLKREGQNDKLLTNMKKFDDEITNEEGKG